MAASHEVKAWTLALSEVLEGHHDELGSSLRVAPDISEKKLRNATALYEVPADEVVIGLMDSTVFGSAKTGLVFGASGVYFRNSLGRSEGTHSVSYEALPACDFDTSVESEVKLGEVFFYMPVPSNAEVAEVFRSVVWLIEARQEQAQNWEGALPAGDVDTYVEGIIERWRKRRDAAASQQQASAEVLEAVAAAWALSLAELLERHAPALESYLWVAPDIPTKKLRNAIERYKVPEDEVAIGLLDCTAFGSAKNGLLCGLRGVYLRTSMGTATGAHAVPYLRLPSSDFNTDDEYVVQMGEVSLGTEGASNDKVAVVLRDVAALVESWRGVLKEHVANLCADQLNEERFAKTAVHRAKDAQTVGEMVMDVATEFGG